MANALSRSAGPHTATLRPPGGMSLARKRTTPFHPKTFVTQVGSGKTTLQCRKNQILFAQGDPADAGFYIQGGRVTLTVVSPLGKQAVVAMLERGAFVGEACLAGELVRMATATSLDASTIMRIDKAVMIRVLHDEPAFSELFLSHLLTRNVRIQEDLVDHLFNSAEERLARTLLLLAHFGEDGQPAPVTPKISQDTLAEMIGTTRSRVSFFMNRFRKLGFVHYDDGLHVHPSLPMSSSTTGAHLMAESSRRAQRPAVCRIICSTLSNCDQTARCLLGIP
jgi:CRP/FNR family transcriptional regulator, cyclic AMP receptor protein